MRILMLSDVYFPRVNGVSTSIKTFREDLARLGHECILVAPGYPHPAEEFDDAGIVRIPSWLVPFDPEDRLLVWRRLMAWAAGLSPGDFDIVHVQTPFTAHYAGIRVAERIGAPVIETYHTYFEHYLHHYVPAIPATLTKSAARRITVSQCNAVSHVISPSARMADKLRDYGVRSPITILPTGLPDGAFVKGDRERFRALHNIPSDRPVALFVGRIAHEKNIEFLVRMVVELRRSVPNVLMLVAGEGPAERHIKSMIGSLDLSENVRMLGNMDRGHTLRDCYAAADVFVFASRTETQGLVLLEAMAQGVPVVSTAVMGTVDVLSGMQGATISPENEAEFVLHVASILNSTDRRARLSRLVEADAQAWSSHRLSETLVELYGSLRSPRNVRRDAA